MGFDRHIVRLMAAMILAIIAYVAPSAVEAHEGHVHCGHHHRAVSKAPTTSVSKANPSLATPSHIAEMPVDLLAAPRFPAVSGRSAGSLQAVDADRGCCPGACKRCCCGTMVCGTLGIVTGPASLSIPVFRAVVMIPHDVTGREGIGPEALRKPPRALA